MDSSLKTEALNVPLHEIGFQIDELTPNKVAGRLQVTLKVCQPFKVLSGGVSALIAEALANMGAVLTSGSKKVVSLHLVINHLKRADLGDLIFAEATPLHVGDITQVWEVSLWKIDPLNSESRLVVSSARVTLLTNPLVANDAVNEVQNLTLYAKL